MLQSKRMDIKTEIDNNIKIDIFSYFVHILHFVLNE